MKKFLSFLFLISISALLTTEIDAAFGQGFAQKTGYKNRTRQPRPIIQNVGVPQKRIKRSPAQLKGFLKSPEKNNYSPQFRIFFLGKSTVNEKDGFYTIPLDDLDGTDISELTLLICNRFHHHYENINTVKDIRIASSKHHKFYKFLHLSDGTWDIQEQKFADLNYIAPEKCIVLMLNPAYVEKVENWNIKLPSQFIPLPKIVLRDDVVPHDILSTQDIKKGRGTLARASRKSLLYSLNPLLFHETTKDHKLTTAPENMTVSMVR